MKTWMRALVDLATREVKKGDLFEIPSDECFGLAAVGHATQASPPGEPIATPDFGNAWEPPAEEPAAAVSVEPVDEPTKPKGFKRA